MELDALVGTAPNTAARLQKLAPPNGVVIGEATYELVAEDFVCEELPPQSLRRNSWTISSMPLTPWSCWPARRIRPAPPCSR
jgi:hypothetical protein